MRSVTVAILIVFIYSCSTVRAQSVDGHVKWNSLPLNDKLRNVWSERGVAIESLRSKDSLVLVDRQTSSGSLSVPVLYKLRENGGVEWAAQSKHVSGTPFSLAVNEVLDVAYAVVSSSLDDASGSQGYVLQFSGVSSSASAHSSALSKVQERVFYRTHLNSGVTKLFDCAVNSKNGDLYITGGTSSSLYNQTHGKGDVIVARLSPSGTLIKGVQFGSEQDEFGRAIDISSDRNELVIAVHRALEGGGSEAIVYKLDSSTLEIIGRSRKLASYGATPLFTANDITVGPPAPDGSVATFMTGKALVIPDQNIDMFVHVFAMLKNSSSDVPIYIDGVSNGKGFDQGVAIRVAPDGNAYCIGVTESSSGSKQTVLLVVSPTGRIVLLTDRKDSSNVTQLERPIAMSLTQFEGRTIVRYVGERQEGNQTKAIFGLAVPGAGVVQPFKGFGSLVKEAAVNDHKPTQERASGEKKIGGLPKKTIIIIATAAVGALAGLGIVVVVALGIRGRSQRSRLSSTSSSSRGSQQPNARIGVHAVDAKVTHQLFVE